MATLILSAVGSAVGGPIGAAIGALVGRAVDSRIIGQPKREGPRLTELAVTTSSYGQPVPRVFGTMRVPGSIVWATDLKQSRETSGGKGQPKTTTYSYAISFAVALSSRPTADIGRVWADGALLRGMAGDLKVGGTMRLHRGLGDETPDPLIVAALGSKASAFRGLAYAVFEDLELASFGNRIPALSFEVKAGDGTLDIVDLIRGAGVAPGASVPLDGLTGFADEGGTRAELLDHVSGVFPFLAASNEQGLGLSPLAATAPSPLPPAIIGRFGSEGTVAPVTTRRPIGAEAPAALRYYDPARDYQPSVQRAPGIGADGETIEFAGVFAAREAQGRIARLRRRALGARDLLSYRISEPAEACAPGRVVTRDGDASGWLVRSSEWHSDGVDLVLERMVAVRAADSVADAGVAAVPPDTQPGELRLRFFEMPWDGSGAGNVAQRYAAVSQSGARGSIALLQVVDDALLPLGLAARGMAVQGKSLAPLAPSPALIFEPDATLKIELSSTQDELQSVDERALLNGANRLLLGSEILQFRIAEPLGSGVWRLTGLLRGRGGTEHHAAAGHPEGTAAVLLDRHLLSLPEGAYREIGAETGLADSAPVYAQLDSEGATLRPLAPVRPVRLTTAGDPEWRWVRRARGAWRWLDGVDAPLVEEREAYRVGFGPVDAPISQWEVDSPSLTLPAAQWAALVSEYPGAGLWVSQIGSHAVSLPTQLPV